MAIIGKREGWRLSPFLLVFLAFDAIYQRLSSSRSAVSPFKPEAKIWLPVSDQPRAFRAEKRKKHARTLRERGAPKCSKMAAILIFSFSTIYYATADIPVSSDNYPTQEESCRCNLAVVRFSYGFLNFKKIFKALDVPAACKQIASTGLLTSWTFLQ